MSLEACVWAWSQTLTPPQKLTLLALADRANAEGYCWPSRADLMHRTGLSHNTLAKCLAHLKREGMIRDSGERRGNRIVVWRVGHPQKDKGIPRSGVTGIPKIETGIPKSGVTGIPKSGQRNLSGESIRTKRRSAPWDDSEARHAAHAAMSEPHWKRMGYPSEEAWEHEQRQKWEVEQERRARKPRKPPANALATLS